jgi:hypothetical protein
METDRGDGNFIKNVTINNSAEQMFTQLTA